MSYREVMNVILPPADGKAAHVTGHYGEMRAKGPHGGSDFNYVGGQSGINLRHPPVHSPVSGTVVFVGGRYGTVTIRDSGGNEHKILHLDTQTVRLKERVEMGAQIGTMGGRGPQGPQQYAQHIHYQMKDRDGHAVNPEAFWQSRRPERGVVQVESDQEVLRLDARGAAVERLQVRLNEIGCRDELGRPLKVDGDFGANTEHAVRTFQQARGLMVDGIVGDSTRNALRDAERRPLLSERTHPDHSLFLQASRSLRELPPATFANDFQLNNAAAAIAASGRLAHLDRIDHVTLNVRGDGFIAVQGGLRDAVRQLAVIDREQAVAQTIATSTTQIPASGTREQAASVAAEAQHVEHRAGLTVGMRP